MNPIGDTRILAIDPGVTTGIASMFNGRVVTVADSRPPHDAVRNTIRVTRPEVVVVEKAPTFQRHHRAEIEEVERIILDEVGMHEEIELVWVTPSQWKNTPASRGEVPVNVSVHGRDACRIAHWFNNTRRMRAKAAAGTDTSRPDEVAP